MVQIRAERSDRSHRRNGSLTRLLSIRANLTVSSLCFRVMPVFPWPNSARRRPQLRKGKIHEKYVVAIGRSHGWLHNRSLASTPLARARVIAKRRFIETSRLRDRSAGLSPPTGAASQELAPLEHAPLPVNQCELHQVQALAPP